MNFGNPNGDDHQIHFVPETYSVDVISAKSPVLVPTPFGKISGRSYKRKVSARERVRNPRKNRSTRIRTSDPAHSGDTHPTTTPTEELEIHNLFRGVMFLSAK